MPKALHRGLAAVPWTLLISSAAVAEVCDKTVGERWQPEDGPIWLLNPVGFPLGLALLICGVVAVAIVGRRSIGYLGAALLMSIAAAGVFADLVSEHDIYLAQIREACRSYQTDLMDVALITAFAFGCGWVGYRA